MGKFNTFILFLIFGVCSLNAQTTLDFETPETSLILQYFGSVLEPMKTTSIANPDKSGLNTSANVGRYVKGINSEVWAGGFASPAPIETIDTKDGGSICVKVWMDHVGNVAIKLENPVGGGENWITQQPYTTANTWQTICFDLKSPSLEDSKLPTDGKAFQQIVMFFDFGIAGKSTEQIYYYDDFTYPKGAPAVESTIYDFENGSNTGEFQYFGSPLDGTKTKVIDNPNSSGINTSPRVSSYTKPAVAEVWAGAFSSPNPTKPVNLTTGSKICIKVHMDHIGNVALKFENSTSGAPNWIQSLPNTKVNEWEELCFEASSISLEAPFEAANSVYETVVIFFDFGTAGTGKDVTSYFDDIIVKSSGAPTNKKVNFKVNMNNYTSSFDGVFISGTFNDWSGESNPLTDPDLDGIWEGSIELANGAYDYKITLDNWKVQEEFLGTEECTRTLDAFTNRRLLVNADTNVPQFCFNSCYACGDEIKLTFRLGMGSVAVSPDGVWLSGGGNFDVPGGKYKMKDMGNKVYEIVVPRKKGFGSFYAFANGACPDFSCKENLEGKPCGDPNNFSDRRLAATNVSTTIATCYGECFTNVQCVSSTNNFVVNNDLFSVKYNPVIGNVLALEINPSIVGTKHIAIYNSLGNRVHSELLDYTSDVQLSDMPNGIYYVTLYTGNQLQTRRFFK